MEDAAQKVRVMDQQRRLKEEARISQLTDEVSVQQRKDQQQAFSTMAALSPVLGDIRKAQDLDALSESQLLEVLMRKNAAKSIGIDMKGQDMSGGTNFFQGIFG